MATTLKISGDTLTLRFPSAVPGPPGTSPPRYCSVLVSGAEASSQVLTTGDSKAVLRIGTELNGLNLTAVGACCNAPGSTSGAVSIQVRRVRAGVGADMLSTAITLDQDETDTTTAAIPAVINTGSDDVLTADQIHIDVDSAGANVRGLVVSLTFE